MAKSDYCLCGACGEKAFYDAELDYKFNETKNKYLPVGCGLLFALCENCSEKFILCIEPKIDKDNHHD